jgi:hypothetical protein
MRQGHSSAGFGAAEQSERKPKTACHHGYLLGSERQVNHQGANLSLGKSMQLAGMTTH